MAAGTGAVNRPNRCCGAVDDDEIGPGDDCWNACPIPAIAEAHDRGHAAMYLYNLRKAGGAVRR
jgi:hypothetical protein